MVFKFLVISPLGMEGLIASLIISPSEMEGLIASLKSVAEINDQKIAGKFASILLHSNQHERLT